MRHIPRQLTFDFPFQARFEREDFIVSASNAKAVKQIDSWPAWPAQSLILEGPSGSGKTHLSHIWAASSGAYMVKASSLTSLRNCLNIDDCLIIEDIGEYPFDETVLFHELNRMNQYGCHCLLTSRINPAQWPVKLADLASRLRACPLIRLDEPDDDLLRYVLYKLFSDRQMIVSANVVDYLIARMERSLATANFLVKLLDLQSLSQSRRITRALASTILKLLPNPDGQL